MAYFDNSATTYPKPDVFYTKLSQNFKDFGVNGSRGKYSKASKLKEVEYELRSNLSSVKFFNIQNPNKIVFTSSATIALNQVLQGLDYSKIKTVYISPFEHNAVYRTILFLQKKYSFKLVHIPFDKFEWNAGKTKLFFTSNSPDLVVLNHASNVFGNVLPVKEIFELAKTYNAVTVLDVAQTAGVISVDLNMLNTDFACFAGHKGLLGPSGIGGIAINTDLSLTPILFGGTGIYSEETEMPVTMPERFEVGSMNSLGIIGLAISVNWIIEIGVKNIRKVKKSNLDKLNNILNKFDEINIIGNCENNIGVLSTIYVDYAPQDIAKFLNDENISVREGMHCAPLAHKHLNTDPRGTVRFSVGYFNDDEEYKELENALSNIF